MKCLIIFITLMLGLTVGLAGASVSADSSSQLFSACNQINNTSPICQDKNTTTNPANRIIKDATDIVAVLTGITAVIMIIIGGLTMATSSGNTEAIAKARKRVLFAAVGLVVVFLAWSLIIFLTDRLIKT